jgi:hypothetical protein
MRREACHTVKIAALVMKKELTFADPVGINSILYRKLIKNSKQNDGMANTLTIQDLLYHFSPASVVM